MAATAQGQRTTVGIPKVGLRVLVLAALLLSVLFMSQLVRRGWESKTAAVPPRPLLAAAQSGPWALVFDDEFDGTAIDADKWTTCYWWAVGNGCANAGDNQLEWNQAENVLVGDGILRLRAQKKTVTGSDGKSHPYTSGMVTSGRASSDLSEPTRFAFRYGFTEIRARVPKGKGLWPAFWLLAADNQSRPEVDIMEVLGHDPATLHMYVHYLGSDGKKVDTGKEWSGPDLSADWHVYGLDWRSNALTWYVDGEPVWNLTTPGSVPQKYLYVILNLAVGGNWPGNPDSLTAFPSYYDVDYVRVWQRSS